MKPKTMPKFLPSRHRLKRFRTTPPEQGCKCNIFCFFFPTFACREDGLRLCIAQARKRAEGRIQFTEKPSAQKKEKRQQIITKVRPLRIGPIGIAQGKTDKKHTGM